jgi:hypothetical protein
MTRMERINADQIEKREREHSARLSPFFLFDLIRDNPPDPRHPRSILRAAFDCDE